MYSADPVVRDLEVMASAVNYRRWVYGLISGYIGERVVELGAGIGNFTEMLLGRRVVVAVDRHPPCIEYLKRRFSGRVVTVNLDISGPGLSELSRYRPDTVICLNVLEHLRDDLTVLLGIHRLVEDGGHLILMVPAFSFLYGSIDRLVGHQRRYSRGEVVGKLTRSGFKVKDVFYMNSLGVAGWFLNNRVLRIGGESPRQVRFYDRFVVPWLSRLEAVMRPPFGMSLIGVGGKEGG